MTYMQSVADWLRERVHSEADLGAEPALSQVLRVMAIWRSRAIAAACQREHGPYILQGPFAGMTYVEEATEGALAPRLLGTYESELHPHLAALARAGLDCVIDVGCAEGYYAVGLARLMPDVVVHAYDIDPRARAACAMLAVANGVADRVVIAEAFDPTVLDAFAGLRCLVMMDVEGAEDDLLTPSAALAAMHVIVETHDLYRPGVLDRLVARFTPTHHIVRVDGGPKTLPLPLPDWLRRQGHLDQLLAVWEWRLRPTPWLVMTPRAKA
jgi:SAM-dependent methyltransferase